MSVTRKRTIWKFAVCEYKDAGRRLDTKGTVQAGSSDLALDQVARGEGYATRTTFHFWGAGGHATYRREDTGTELHVVVVAAPGEGVR